MQKNDWMSLVQIRGGGVKSVLNRGNGYNRHETTLEKNSPGPNLKG